jgi:hypothetical protein
MLGPGPPAWKPAQPPECQAEEHLSPVLVSVTVALCPSTLIALAPAPPVAGRSCSCWPLSRVAPLPSAGSALPASDTRWGGAGGKWLHLQGTLGKAGRQSGNALRCTQQESPSSYVRSASGPCKNLFPFSYQLTHSDCCDLWLRWRLTVLRRSGDTARSAAPVTTLGVDAPSTSGKVLSLFL